jgi:hypothetical protein
MLPSWFSRRAAHSSRQLLLLLLTLQLACCPSALPLRPPSLHPRQFDTMQRSEQIKEFRCFWDSRGKRFHSVVLLGR